MKGLFGQGALNVGGHKISYGLLAALAGIAGAILLVIQLHRSQSSVGAGSPAYDPNALADTTGFGSGGFAGTLVTSDGSTGTNGSSGISNAPGLRASSKQVSSKDLVARAAAVTATTPSEPFLHGIGGGDPHGPPLSRKPAQSI